MVRKRPNRDYRANLSGAAFIWDGNDRTSRNSCSNASRCIQYAIFAVVRLRRVGRCVLGFPGSPVTVYSDGADFPVVRGNRDGALASGPDGRVVFGNPIADRRRLFLVAVHRPRIRRVVIRDRAHILLHSAVLLWNRPRTESFPWLAATLSKGCRSRMNSADERF